MHRAQKDLLIRSKRRTGSNLHVLIVRVIYYPLEHFVMGYAVNIPSCVLVFF